MNTTVIFKQIPLLPSIPQAEVKGEENVENPIIPSSSVDLPQGEGVAGCEGLTTKEMLETVNNCSETFSDKINPNDLPPLLQDIEATQKELVDKDTITLGALDIFSGAMPGVFGIYDKRKVYPPFYSIIYAPPSSDKGMLNACRKLVEPIEKEIESVNEQKKTDYQIEMNEYLALDRGARFTTPSPKVPAYSSLWIPANSSATACYQALSDNGGWGLSFETEADTLSTALNSEYGDYSDGLRKGFHHEPITYRRRKENEFIKIDEPRWAIMLTCTPGQIPFLFKSFENGLGSRFVFYRKNRKLFWRNVFEQSDKTIDELFLEFGQRYKQIYDELVKRNDRPFQVIFSISQQEEFNKFFEELQLEQVGLYGDDMIACVRRLGLVCFRIAMVLTILRHEGCMPIIELMSQAIVCDDRDFKTSMTIVNCLINHTAHVYSEVLNQGNDNNLEAIMKMSNQESLLFKALEDDFTTDEARKAAIKLGIAWKTAERYIGKFAGKYGLTVRITNGHYKKVKPKDDSIKDDHKECT